MEPFKHEVQEKKEEWRKMIKEAGEKDERARNEEFDDREDYNFDSSFDDSSTSGSEGDADSDAESDTDDDRGDDTERETMVKKQVPTLPACKSNGAVTQPVISTPPEVIDLASSSGDESTDDDKGDVREDFPKRKRGSNDTPMTKSANKSANKKQKSVVEFAIGDGFVSIGKNIQLFFKLPRSLKNSVHIGRKTVKGSTLLRDVTVKMYVGPELRVGKLSTLFDAGDNKDMWVHFLQRKASSFEDGVVSLIPFFRIWYTGFKEHDVIDRISMSNSYYGHENNSQLWNTVRLKRFAEMQMSACNVHVEWKDNVFQSRMYFVSMGEDTPKSRFMANVYIMCEQLLDKRFKKDTAVPIVERFSRLELVNNVTLSKPVRCNMMIDASDLKYNSPYDGMEELLPRAPDSDDEILCLHSFMTRLQQGYEMRCGKVSARETLQQGYWENIVKFPFGVSISFYTVQTITKFLGVRRGSSSEYTTTDLCHGATFEEELEWENTIKKDDVRPIDGGEKFAFRSFGWCPADDGSVEVVNWLRHPIMGVKNENWYLSVPEGFTEPVPTSDLQVPCLDEKNTMVLLTHLKEAVTLMRVCSDTAVTEVDVLLYLKYYAKFQDQVDGRYKGASRLKQVVLRMYMGDEKYTEECMKRGGGGKLLKDVNECGLKNMLKTKVQAQQEDLSGMWSNSSDDDDMSE